MPGREGARARGGGRGWRDGAPAVGAGLSLIWLGLWGLLSWVGPLWVRARLVGRPNWDADGWWVGSRPVHVAAAMVAVVNPVMRDDHRRHHASPSPAGRAGKVGGLCSCRVLYYGAIFLGVQSDPPSHHFRRVCLHRPESGTDGGGYHVPGPLDRDVPQPAASPAFWVDRSVHGHRGSGRGGYVAGGATARRGQAGDGGGASGRSAADGVSLAGKAGAGDDRVRFATGASGAERSGDDGAAGGGAASGAHPAVGVLDGGAAGPGNIAAGSGSLSAQAGGSRREACTDEKPSATE